MAFLDATTEVMEPAPIDSLLNLLPVFSRWFEGFTKIERSQVFPADFGTTVGLTACRLSCLDDSPEAVCLMEYHKHLAC